MTAGDCHDIPPRFPVLRPLKTRYRFASSFVIVPSGSMKPGLPRRMRVSRSRSARRKQRCCIGSRGESTSSKEGPPGTRRAPSATVDSFGASVRTRSAYLPRRGAQKGPGTRCPYAKNIFTRRRISAVAKRDRVLESAPTDRSRDRSLRVRWPDVV